MLKANIHIVVAAIVALLGSTGIPDDSISHSFTIDTRDVDMYVGDASTFDWTFAVGMRSDVFVGDTGGYYCDQDGDGLPDWWEMRYSSSMSKTGFLAEADQDGDGIRNLYEFVSGTDPTNETSVFKASIAFDDEGRPVISWSPELSDSEKAKRVYKKYGKARLNDNAWSLIDGDEPSYNFFKVTVEMRQK